MNVISLFDGISCGQVALQRLGILIKMYLSSEIDKTAIDITQKNFPNTIQIGDVTKLDFSQFKDIDLIMGGSPCQNLTRAVANMDSCNQGLKGDKSKLFYYFVEALQTIKPKFFLLENVGSMSNDNRDIISKTLGVEPIRINSNLVSAQDRDRYYWTNIPSCGTLEPKHIILKEIVLEAEQVPEKYWYKIPFDYTGDDNKIQALLHTKGLDISKRVYNLNSTVGTLTRCGGGNHQKKVYQNGRCRKLMPIEYERLQTLPDNYTEGYSDTKRWNVLGSGWTVDVICYLMSYLKTIYN